MTDDVLHVRSVTRAFRGERLALPHMKFRPVEQNFPVLGYT